ncbi:MAG: thiazolinyl imide reductase [Firmicutes bacterium]|nr:thiazolinyl imide reductase [Bacillota bacterium]
MSGRKKLRVIVCGTTFGRMYLRAIEQLNSKFKLVGILARGSSHSVECAKKYNVPLYTDIEEISKENADLACVVVRSAVVGGAGTDIAKRLLKKGIHILIEQPVHLSDMTDCLRIAKKSSSFYRINSFYPELESVKTFIDMTKQILKESKPLFVDAYCSIQVLFPMVDILGQILGGFRPWKFQKNSKQDNGPFTMLTGEIKDVPISLRVQNQMNPEDPDSNFLLLHRVILVTDRGTLIMTDSNGMVIWHPQMSVLRRANNVEGNVSEDFNDYPIIQIITADNSSSFSEVFSKKWPDAIVRALEKFGEVIETGEESRQFIQHQLTMCQIWKEIGSELGTVELSNNEYMPLFVKF